MGSRGYSRAIAAGLAAFLAAFALFAADGRATDLGHDSYKAAAPAPTSQWELDVTPYGWFINLEGDLEFGIVRHSVEYNFVEILTDTETPYEIDGAFELRKGPISFFGRLDFMKLEVDQVNTFDLRPVRFFEIDVNADVNVTTDNLIVEGGASLELFKTALSAAANPHARSGFVAFDLLGGARYNNLKNTSDIQVDIREDFDPKFIPLRITGEQRIVRRIVQDNSWVDPFVGGRVRMETPGGLQIFARGDVGGFHVGSDFVWNVIGGVGGGVWFCDCEQLTWVLAYRALDTDYVTGSGFERFNYDMLIHGPISGVTYRF